MNAFCNKCGHKLTEGLKFCSNCGNPISSITVESKSNIIEEKKIVEPSPIKPVKQISERERKRRRFFTILILLVAGLGYAGYYFFIRHDPIKDAKKAADAYCDCTVKYYDALIKTNEGFIKSFDSYNFKKRQDARNKLHELQNAVTTSYTTCNSNALVNYNELRNRFVTTQEEIRKFDFAYSAQQGICSLSNQSKLTSLNSETENKISTIVDPEPDVLKIETDLIGKQIQGWNFDVLSEFNQTAITNTFRGTDRIEYTITTSLVGYRTSDVHEAQLIVTYNQGFDGWYFGDVKEVYITFEYNAPVNQWQEVTPLSNCTYTINHNDEQYWVQDGSYGSKYKAGGTDGETFYLRSSQIYLMSRETHPLKIVFKYTPSNNGM